MAGVNNVKLDVVGQKSSLEYAKAMLVVAQALDDAITDLATALQNNSSGLDADAKKVEEDVLALKQYSDAIKEHLSNHYSFSTQYASWIGERLADSN